MDMDVGQHGSREAQSAVCFHGGCGSSLSQTVSSMTPFCSRCGGFVTTGKEERQGKRDKQRQRERETEKRKRKDEKESERKN